MRTYYFSWVGYDEMPEGGEAHTFDISESFNEMATRCDRIQADCVDSAITAWREKFEEDGLQYNFNILPEAELREFQR
jgi:hypothetical protein